MKRDEGENEEDRKMKHKKRGCQAPRTSSLPPSVDLDVLYCASVAHVYCPNQNLRHYSTDLQFTTKKEMQGGEKRLSLKCESSVGPQLAQPTRCGHVLAASKKLFVIIYERCDEIIVLDDIFMCPGETAFGTMADEEETEFWLLDLDSWGSETRYIHQRNLTGLFPHHCPN